MADSGKKLGLGPILMIVGAVLGVAGLVVMLVCNAMGSDYEFSYSALLDAGAVAGAVLAVAAAVLPRTGADKNGYLSLVAAVGSVFLYGYTAIQAVSGRILVISALYTWNTGNTTGWTAFYFTIAVVACLAAGAVAEIVGAFMPSAGKASEA